jgi:phospholipase/lecithinase/hemolysin
MNTTRQILIVAVSLAVPLAALAQPTIVVQPQDQTASLFAGAIFRVTATSAQPVSYQWQFNLQPIDGGVSNSLTIINVQKTNAGPYSVVVSDSTGSVTSQVVTLAITPFNSIYAFGYSWTDTRGLAPNGSSCGWNPPLYYPNHACNGAMWPEFLSTNLGLAYQPANNYAQCGAGPSDVLNQVVSNFRPPPKPELSLYFLMFCDDALLALRQFGGSSYLDVTNETAWNHVIQTGILANSNAVSRLYAKGARSIVAQSVIDLSTFPEALATFGADTNRLDTNRLAKLSEYESRYNSGFRQAMNAYGQTTPDLRIVWVDLFSDLNAVLREPAIYGFTKTTIDALDDPALTDKALNGSGADYVFWNGLHPTSKLQALIATWSLIALTNATLEQLELSLTGGSPILNMNHLQIGREYTLQRSPDLSIWTDVQQFTANTGTDRWSGALENQTSAYFRLRWEP